MLYGIFDCISLEFITKNSQTISIFITVLLFLLVYRQARKIIRARIFVEYTKRFSEIETEFFELQFGFRDEIKDDAQMKNARRIIAKKYINLCSEEYHLYMRGLVEKEVWNYWVRGMSAILKIPEYKPILEEFISEFEEYYPKFHAFLTKNVVEE